MPATPKADALQLITDARDAFVAEAFDHHDLTLAKDALEDALACERLLLDISSGSTHEPGYFDEA